MAIGYTENIFSKFKTQSVSVFAVVKGDLYTKAQSLVKIPCGKSAQYSAQIAYKGAGSYSPAQSWVFACIAHTSLECGKVCYYFFFLSLLFCFFFLARAKETW